MDLCLVAPLPDDPAFTARPLDEQRLHLVVPADHRLAGRRRIRLAEVAEEPFVGLERGYGLRAITDGFCAQAGFVPRLAFEEETETLRGLVAAGLGVALLPPALVPLTGGGGAGGDGAAHPAGDRAGLGGGAAADPAGGGVPGFRAVAAGAVAAPRLSRMCRGWPGRWNSRWTLAEPAVLAVVGLRA